MQFQISSRKENTQRDTRVIKIKFKEKFSGNNFALSDQEDNTSTLLNRGRIADLPLLRTLLAIRQTSREPSFWEVMESFVLVAYTSLAASRTVLQWLLACLNFTLDPKKIYPFGTNEKSDFYELLKQLKKLKTMEMSEAWSDLFYEGYIHQLQPEPTYKIH